MVVARLVPENNVDLTLDALELKVDPRSAAVGVGSRDSRGISTAAPRSTTQGQERWLGHVHDQELLTQFWSNCGVYVHGHSVGGTNPALLQALGAGAPTLALDTRFNREVIDAPEQLYQADAKDLAARIDSLLGDPERRAAIASAGRRRIAADYSWDAVCAGYLGVLERLANG